MVTVDALNLKSIVYPCADRLVFRDLHNDLTFLDLNVAQLKATGNFTSTRDKGYLCHPQWEVGVDSFIDRTTRKVSPLLSTLAKFMKNFLLPTEMVLKTEN